MTVLGWTFVPNMHKQAESAEIEPMSMLEILEGILAADCRELLCDHLKKVSAQVAAGTPICCREHWVQVQELTQQRLSEFAGRVYH